MRTVIYSRCSTDMQDTQNQVQSLLVKYPNAEIVEEYGSGVKVRPKLDALIAELKAGDQLIIYALDRLGRSTSDVLSKIEYMDKAGIILVSVREGFDFNTPVGKFATTIFIAFAELERNLISERIRAALKVKKAAGVHLGRRFSIPEKTWDAAKALRDAGMTFREIEKELDISRSRLSEYFREVK